MSYGDVINLTGMPREELLKNFIEVDILNEGNFLKIKETLTRMGVASVANKTLYQSCHILHKKGRYYIVSFKELFAMDGLQSVLTLEDLQRRNTIATLLEQWGFLRIIKNKPNEDEILEDRQKLFILPYREKLNWTLEVKYTIGKKFEQGEDRAYA